MGFSNKWGCVILLGLAIVFHLSALALGDGVGETTRWGDDGCRYGGRRGCGGGRRGGRGYGRGGGYGGGVGHGGGRGGGGGFGAGGGAGGGGN
ncbi:hypothetical protein HanIR_Chr10g0486231 [Helianthus annuus]|nr:hypothetical protein HanIR_Chr10g0486231 [Helianthus annuus]